MNIVASAIVILAFAAWTFLAWALPGPKEIVCGDGEVAIARWHFVGLPAGWACIAGRRA